jgi:3-oxoacyl-[acyl-carrier protein] reductase
MKRVAIVTGAAQGIGHAVARRLCAAGHRVLLVDRDGEALRRAPADFPPDSFACLTTDVTELGSPAMISRAVLERWGTISILVNNAAVSPKIDGRSPGLLETSDELWDDVQAVNLRAMFRLCREVLPAMKEAAWGRVVNIASLAGRSRSLIAGPAYMASKAGVLGLTRSIASEFAAFGITANCIAPGRIETRLARQTDEMLNASYVTQIPVRRFGAPAEVAAAVCYLVSEDSGFVTGAVLDVNCGLFMA